MQILIVIVIWIVFLVARALILENGGFIIRPLFYVLLFSTIADARYMYKKLKYNREHKDEVDIRKLYFGRPYLGNKDKKTVQWQYPYMKDKSYTIAIVLKLNSNKEWIDSMLATQLMYNTLILETISKYRSVPELEKLVDISNPVKAFSCNVQTKSPVLAIQYYFEACAVLLMSNKYKLSEYELQVQLDELRRKALWAAVMDEEQSDLLNYYYTDRVKKIIRPHYQHNSSPDVFYTINDIREKYAAAGAKSLIWLLDNPSIVQTTTLSSVELDRIPQTSPELYAALTEILSRYFNAIEKSCGTWKGTGASQAANIN